MVVFTGASGTVGISITESDSDVCARHGVLLVKKGVVVMGASLSVTPIIISLLVSISVSNKTHTTHTETENSVDTPHRRGNS